MKQIRQLAFAAMTVLAMKANAAILITFNEVGPDVVATASGSADLSGLTLSVTSYTTISAGVIPSWGIVSVRNGLTDLYTGAFTWNPWGVNSNPVSATASSGDAFGFSTFFINGLYLPAGYQSGAPLFSTSTYANTTIQSMGLDKGTWVYPFGTDAVTFTVVPEPHQYAMMAGVGLVGLGLWRRHARK